ncbi:polysaccharide biosynthesis/export family protein [Sulfurovum sp.]|uniref:polysaccharide biosynthesis/export family protein n=1 Tax=Sulfurovum sp. TaxID=1969726 RepID=UPI0025FC55F0|nr:polysaccharide biosynthesis/export family protein [Sulfurovum sp.]
MKKHILLLTLSGILLFILNGCIASSGPRKAQVLDIDRNKTNVSIVKIDANVAQKTSRNMHKDRFSKIFRSGKHNHGIGVGDTLSISIWEAAPATLFGGSMAEGNMGSSSRRSATVIEQVVQRNGTISVPFVGTLFVKGITEQKIAKMIVKKLKGKANDPQVIVKRTQNVSNTVTVVGEVMKNMKVPLYVNRERILDVLAMCGGVKHPVDKVTLQVMRHNKIASMSMSDVIKDPRQNIVLNSDDIVTVKYQPLSFSVMGAVAKNEERFFEVQGISLIQGLARVGGLSDQKANAEGVFVFRYEDGALYNKKHKVPTIYHISFEDPNSFFIAQKFMLKNNDVVYVSESMSTDLQKVLSIVTTIIYSIATPVQLSKI